VPCCPGRATNFERGILGLGEAHGTSTAGVSGKFAQQVGHSWETSRATGQRWGRSAADDSGEPG